MFGREEDIAFLDRAWLDKDINVVTVVAWAGVGKSTLVNRWLAQMASERYRAAELVFGWSSYRQGTSSGTSFASDHGGSGSARVSGRKNGTIRPTI